MEERLKALRKALGLTQQELAEKIGIKRNTFAQYENGRNVPIDAVIKLICDTFRVNEDWLRTGAGEMFVEVSQHDEIQRMVDELLLDDSDDLKRSLVAAILRLSPAQIRAAVEWIKETFNLVEAEEPTIEEEVQSYREELEAEAAFEKLSLSDTGKEKRA